MTWILYGSVNMTLYSRLATVCISGTKFLINVHLTRYFKNLVVLCGLLDPLRQQLPVFSVSGTC